MNESAPKPGSHVSLDDRIAAAVAESLNDLGVAKAPTPPFVNYRDLAKHHAKCASELATYADADNARGTFATEDIALATAHALVSIACSHVSPPARHQRTPEPRVVRL